MEVVFQNTYVRMQFDAETNVMFIEWFPRSKFMSRNYFNIIFYLTRNKLVLSNTHYLLIDIDNWQYTISQDEQKWLVEHWILPLQEFGVKKIATLQTPQEVEQANFIDAEKVLMAGLLMQSFSDFHIAKQWILTI